MKNQWPNVGFPISNDSALDSFLRPRGWGGHSSRWSRRRSSPSRARSAAAGPSARSRRPSRASQLRANVAKLSGKLLPNLVKVGKNEPSEISQKQRVLDGTVGGGGGSIAKRCLTTT